MKKILGLSVAALMVMGLVGGGTWAYFNDTEIISGNALIAGTLNLAVDKTAYFTVDVEDAAPSLVTSAASLGNVVLTNSGSIDGTLSTISIANLVDTEGTFSDHNEVLTKLAGIPQGTAADADGDLSKYLKVAFFIDLDDDGILSDDDIVLTSDPTDAGTYSTLVYNETTHAAWTVLNDADADSAGVWGATLFEIIEDNAEWDLSSHNIDLTAGSIDDVELYVWYWFEHDGARAEDDGTWEGNPLHASHDATLIPYGKMYVQNIAQGDSLEFDVVVTLDQDINP